MLYPTKLHTVQGADLSFPLRDVFSEVVCALCNMFFPFAIECSQFFLVHLFLPLPIDTLIPPSATLHSLPSVRSQSDGPSRSTNPFVSYRTPCILSLLSTYPHVCLHLFSIAYLPRAVSFPRFFVRTLPSGFSQTLL